MPASRSRLEAPGVSPSLLPTSPSPRRRLFRLTEQPHLPSHQPSSRLSAGPSPPWPATGAGSCWLTGAPSRAPAQQAPGGACSGSLRAPNTASSTPSRAQALEAAGAESNPAARPRSPRPWDLQRRPRAALCPRFNPGTSPGAPAGRSRGATGLTPPRAGLAGSASAGPPRAAQLWTAAQSSPGRRGVAGAPTTRGAGAVWGEASRVCVRGRAQPKC